ncbi:hypothetical protein [Deinococcus altitudinis]|uniref:hypothetical protein n=1 Tax=Deinococcus altitudinis TaxID=468914 RepID=UPI003891B7EE
MSANYTLFGWIYDCDVPNILSDMRLKWQTQPLKNEDNNGLTRETLRITDKYNFKDEFNKSFVLHIYQPYDLKLARSSQDISSEMELSGILLDHSTLRPIIIDFDSFALDHVRTSLPIIEQLVDLCNIIKPILVFSISHELLYDPETFNPPKPSLFDHPSVYLAAEYTSGLCVISALLLPNDPIDKNSALYKQIDYKYGKIMCGPYGISYSHEKTAYFYDRSLNLYVDEKLDEILTDKWSTHVDEVKRIIKNI